MRARWLSWFAAEHLLWVPVLAVVLCMPALFLGLQADDWALLAAVRQGAAPWALYDIIDSEADALRLRSTGLLPWWTPAEARLRFMRPLATTMHWLEFHALGETAWPMYLVNIALYGLSVLLALQLYRRWLPQRAARYAAIVFAISACHGQTVGWVSARSGLLALCFSLLALKLHCTSCEKRHSHGLRWLSVGCTLLALLSGEAGIMVCAYLVGYALVPAPPNLSSTQEPQKIPASGHSAVSPGLRLRALWPHALVGGAWATSYLLLGYGARGLGWYRSPTDGAAIGEGLLEMPIRVTSLLGPSIANLLLFSPPAHARILGALLALPLLWLCWRPATTTWQGRRFATTAAIAMLPLALTIPQDRVLIGASFAGAGLLGLLFAQPSSALTKAARGGRKLLRVTALWLAPVFFVLNLLFGLSGFQSATARLNKLLPFEAGVTTVMLNPPLIMVSAYAYAQRLARGQPVSDPRHVLYVGASDMTVTRVGPHTLELDVDEGFAQTPTEHLCMAANRAPQVGEVRQLDRMRVETLQAGPDGMPKRVRFDFKDALDPSAIRWVVWTGNTARTWTPPAIGAQERIPGVAATTALSP